MKRSIYFLILYITLIQSQSYAQISEQRIKEYKNIADTIINNIVKLEAIYPQLKGIANNETFKTITNSDDRTIINLHFFDGRARGINTEYYLIIDLNFYICRKPTCEVYVDKDQNIGEMKVSLSILGTGNDDLSDKIASIINKSKTNYEQK